MSHKIEKPFTARFLEGDEQVLLELTNTTVLKEQRTPGSGPSRPHIAA
jgi:hypothetical protein